MTFAAGGHPAAPYGPGSPPPAAPRKRAWGRVVLGVLGILVVAVPMLVAALVILVGVSRVETLDPEAQGAIPGTLELDADEGTTYVVALGSGFVREIGGNFNTSWALDIRCTITHPDGTQDEIRGDRQTSSVTKAGTYASIGRFEGRGGATDVDCVATDTTVFGEEPELPGIVHETNATLQWVGIGLAVGACAVALACTGLIVWGVRGKKV